MAGFPGCIGSTDETHIPLVDNKVTASSRQAHIGYKLGSDATTRTYNLTINHRRQICLLLQVTQEGGATRPSFDSIRS